MVFISPQVDIAIITFVLAIVSQVLRRTLMNPAEMKEKQAVMKEKQEKMKELMKKDDHKSTRELEALQQEMMESMGEMMSGSMKLMFVSMIIFLPVFWFLGSVYGEAVVSLPIPIPWVGGPFLIQLYNETNWMGWYILTSLFFSIILNIVIGQVEKIMKGGVNASTG